MAVFFIDIIMGIASMGLGTDFRAKDLTLPKKLPGTTLSYFTLMIVYGIFKLIDCFSQRQLCTSMSCMGSFSSHAGQTLFSIQGHGS